jgi:hypothetical protein
MKYRALWLVVALVLSALTIVSVPATAWAQAEEIEELLGEAIDEYDVLEVEAAAAKIEEGLRYAADHDVTDGIPLGKLYVMQGIIEYATTGDTDQVQESFANALRAEPKMDLPDVYRTPDLDEILAAAREEVGAAGPDRPPTGAGINHLPLTDVSADQPVIFEVFVPRDMAVYKMYVFFRVLGEEGWKKVELQPTNAERFAVQVAGTEFAASQFDYYVLAEDRGGNTVGHSGSEPEPHNVVVLGSGGSDGEPEDTGDDKEKKKKKKKEKKPKAPGDQKDTIMYVSVLFGTSPGFLSGAGNNLPTAHPERNVSPGLAMAFAHTALDFGATLTPNMYLGMYFRFQFAPAQNFEGLPPSTTTGGGFPSTKKECLGLGLPGDCLLGLKYRLFVNDNQRVRLFTSIGAGVGRIRNWLRLKQQTNTPIGESLCLDKPTQSGTTESGESVEFCYIRDTVRTGWLHFGAGGGAAFMITDFMDLVLDTYLMVNAPVTSVNLDLSGGLMFKF